MTTDQIRNMHQARPFQPFEIHLADGRALAVDHPECLALAPGGRTIGIAIDNIIEIVDVLLVTSLKPKPNGRSRRRK